MSLDETGKTVWETTRPPLAMLVATRATQVLAEPLEPEAQAAFEALARALEEWWPRRKRDAEDIHKTEFTACIAAANAADTDAARAALDGAYVALAHLLKARPKSLPAGRYYEMGEDEFVVLLRSAAKASRIPIAQLESRLKMMLEHKTDKWPELVARIARMRWARVPPWGKLDKRIRALAALADLGASATWSRVGSQNALRLELDDVKRITVLAPEELEALRAVIPSIPTPPAG